jgi:hypothetical protein
MQDQSKQIAQDPNLSGDQRALALQQLRAEAQQRATQLFGDKAGEVLQRLPNMRVAERLGLPLNNIQVVPNPGATVP